MGNRRWVAAVVLAICGSLLAAPAAAAAAPPARMDDDGLLPPIEIRLPFIHIRIGGEEPEPTPPPTPTPTPTATPTPAPTDEPEPEPSPESESESRPEPRPEPESTAQTTTELSTQQPPADREPGRGGIVGTGRDDLDGAGTGGISRSEWPAVEATVAVGAESVSVSRVRVDETITAALGYAAIGFGLVAVGAAVLRRRLVAAADPRAHHRDA